MAIEFKNVNKIIGPGGKEVTKITRTSDSVVLWQKTGDKLIDENGYWKGADIGASYIVHDNGGNVKVFENTGSSYLKINKRGLEVTFPNKTTGDIDFFIPKKYAGKTLHFGEAYLNWSPSQSYYLKFIFGYSLKADSMYSQISVDHTFSLEYNSNIDIGLPDASTLPSNAEYIVFRIDPSAGGSYAVLFSDVYIK